jgi:hypothetical protein
MHISTNDLHCCKPARPLQLAPSGGRPSRRPPATATPRIAPPHQQQEYTGHKPERSFKSTCAVFPPWLCTGVLALSPPPLALYGSG